jgi:hypothetical protein
MPRSTVCILPTETGRDPTRRNPNIPTAPHAPRARWRGPCLTGRSGFVHEYSPKQDDSRLAPLPSARRPSLRHRCDRRHRVNRRFIAGHRPRRGREGKLSLIFLRSPHRMTAHTASEPAADRPPDHIYIPVDNGAVPVNFVSANFDRRSVIVIGDRPNRLRRPDFSPAVVAVEEDGTLSRQLFRDDPRRPGRATGQFPGTGSRHASPRACTGRSAGCGPGSGPPGGFLCDPGDRPTGHEVARGSLDCAVEFNGAG